MRSQEQAKATMDMSEEPFCVEIYRKKCTWTCQKSHFVWKFTGKKAQAQVTGAILWLPGTTFWMEVEAHVTRAILYGNLQEKCRTRMLGTAFCVEIFKKNAGGYFRGPHFVWKFTGKKRAWTLHTGHFVWKFAGKMPHAPVPTWTYTGPFVLLP